MVLVCHDHRFIFLKTTKTGGTSIEMALQPLCMAPGSPVIEATPTLISEHGIVGARLPQELPEGEGVVQGWKNHRSAAWIHNKLGDELFDGYRKITIVRNPFDRTVSLFHYTMQRHRNTFDDFDAVRDRFRGWVRRDWQDDRKIVFLERSFVPQTVLRFERMRDDLQALFDALGVAMSADTLPHTKPTTSERKKHGVADYYDDASRDRVLKRLGWVFEHAGYPATP